MRPLAIRFGGFYASMFLVVGIQIPYWPVWLEDKGITTAEIGILLATLLWVKVAFNPIAGHLVDAIGRRRPIMLALCVGALLTYMAFPFADTFTSLLALSIISGALFAALLPIADNLTMIYVIKHNLDYGRIRLWGSLAFIGTSIAVGKILDIYGAHIVIWLIIIAMLPLCLLALRLPEAPNLDTDNQDRLRWADLFQDKVFWVFLITTSMIGASHAAYYAFATLHWLNSGIDHMWVGTLWGIGVGAEVILFAFSRTVVQKIGPYWLLILGGIGGIVRWTLLAYVTDPWILVPIQALHGLTFGATHLGAMHFIAQKVAPNIMGRAQSLYAAMGNGVVLGGLTILAGALFTRFDGLAFLAMSASSCVGLIAAFYLPKAVAKQKGSRVIRKSL